MKKFEEIGSMIINVEEALQYLMGETEFKSKVKLDDGEVIDVMYILKFYDHGDEIQVVVDTDSFLGINCVFNETYSVDSYAKNPFSFEQLINDLHAQRLYGVEDWLFNFLEKNFTDKVDDYLRYCKEQAGE